MTSIIFNYLIIYAQVVSCQRYPPIYYLVKDFPSDDKTFSGFAEVRVHHWHWCTASGGVDWCHDLLEQVISYNLQKEPIVSRLVSL